MDKVFAAKRVKTSNYRHFDHVSATSNVVERLFSQAKLVMTPERRGMDPSTLESILMLRFNRDLWDIYLVDAVVDKVQSGGDGPAAAEELVQGEDDMDADDDLSD